MSSKLSNNFRTVSIPAGTGGTQVDYAGLYFICTYASNGRFEMSVDGNTFFEFQKGLKFGPVEFQKLWFRAIGGVANTIGFYHGTVPVADARLNVIDDQNLSTIYTKPAPFTCYPVFNGAFGATDNQNLDGFRSVGGLTKYRRTLEIIHFAAGKFLLVTPDAGGPYPAPFRIAANIPMSLPISGQISIALVGAVAVDCSIYETLWNA